MIFDRELTAGERSTIQSYCVTTYPGVIDARIAKFGASGFAVGNYLTTATPGGEVGTAAGFGGCALYRLNALGNPGITARSRPTPPEGWELHAASNALRISMIDGVGTSITAPTYTMTANDIGKWDLVVWQHDGSFVRMYRARAQVGTGTAITGFTPYASAPQYIGCRSPGVLVATGLSIAAVMTWTGTPTNLAAIQALYDFTKATGDVPNTVAGVTVTHLWSVTRDQLGGVMPIVLNDYAGADPMSVVGTLTASPGANEPWTY
jgi:hypothetical protein